MSYPWSMERLYLDDLERDVVDFVTIAHVQLYILYVWSWKDGRLRYVLKAVDRQAWDNAHPFEQGMVWAKMSKEWRRNFGDTAPKDRHFVVRLSPSRGSRQARRLGSRSSRARGLDSSV